MPDNAEILASFKKQEQEKSLKKQYEVLKFHYPVAKLTKLINDENWDLYRSLLKGKMEEWEKSLSITEERLKDPNADDAELPRLKRNYLLVKAQIDAFLFAVDLPIMLIDDVRKAEKALNEFNPGVKEDSPTKETKDGRKTTRSRNRTV